MQSTIERITEAALQQVQKDLGLLVAADTEITLRSASLTQKSGLIESISGKNCVIGLELSGTYDGEGCLVLPQDTVVRLGGKLLMLPPAEINEIIAEDQPGEEIQEIQLAFDEVVKCLLRSFIGPFQSGNLVISSICFKEQQTIIGRHLAGILDYLPGDQTYYLINASLDVGGARLDEFWLLLPAFILVCGPSFKQHSSGPDDAIYEDENADDAAGLSTGPLKRGMRITSSHALNRMAGEMMDSLVTAFEGELRSLLGPAVRVYNAGSWECAPTEIKAHLKAEGHAQIPLLVEGELSGRGAVLAEPDDATRLGLLLTEGIHGGIVPLNEDTSFNADCQDGYQEIGVLLADVVASIWDDKSGGDLISLRAGTEPNLDAEIGSPDDDFLAGENYLWFSLGLITGDLECGTLQLILPSELGKYWTNDEGDKEQNEFPDLGHSSSISSKSNDGTIDSAEAELGYGQIKVLLIEYSKVSADAVRDALESGGIEGEVRSIAEELRNTDLESYRSIILAVEKLDEMALGAVIKLKSLSSVPLIVAGSQWTQTDVLKAVRFGVDDILMIPIGSEELARKITGLEQLAIPS